jgi:hypothetical protein
MKAPDHTARYFDPACGNISSYFCQLYLRVGKNEISYCILDTERSRFLALAAFQWIEPAREPVPVQAQLEYLLQQEEWLRKKFPAVIAGIDSPYHTLVPNPLFSSSRSQEYLDFNFRVPANYICLEDPVDEAGAFNVSSVPLPLKEMLADHFGKPAIVHASTAFLKAAWQHHKAGPPTAQLFLNLRNQEIDLVYYDQGKLHLFNSFQYGSKEEVLYYTLYFLEQAAVLPQQAQLNLCGMIGEETEVYQLLANYFGQITLAGRLPVFSYSPILDQLPEQQYQDLFALALCGS